MKTELQRHLSSLCAAVVLIAVPLASHGVPITYNLGVGSGLQAATDPILDSGSNNTGYYTNSTKTGMSGSLTLDMADLSSTSGSLTGAGDFGLGADTWTIDFSGASAGTVAFVDGDTDLLSLGYTLSSIGGYLSSGTFYFADRDFNGGTISDGPNYIDPSVLYLWGNNWINASGGSTDRDTFVAPCGGGILLTLSTDCGGTALGLDLYGEARTVPEPGIAALLAMGLLGMVFIRYFKRRSKLARTLYRSD